MIVIDAGTWITVTVSEPVAAFPAFVWITSPPPNTFAVFCTEVGESAGTLTVSVMSGNVPPLPATTSLEVHVAVLVPEQVQFVPVPDAKV